MTTNTSALDNRNVVMFRNSSSGSAVATTYTWYSGGERVDSDIIFWDGAYEFFTGTTGCSMGAYIEDIATHELGHTLGLGHSSQTAATMYATYSYCSQSMRSLTSDDVAGLRDLYPDTGSTNTVPSVSIATPASGSAVGQGTAISFSGSAIDTEDGPLTTSLVWTSNVDGQIGTGGSFSRALSAGSHTITARATDSGGLSASRRST